MAVAFSNATTVAEATAVNATYTAPTGITNGNLLLIWHFVYNGAGAPVTPTPPTGFAAPAGAWPIHVVVGAQQADSYLWYKIAASESGNYVVTHASSVRRGIMALVTGNHTTTPFEANPTLNSGTVTTTTFTGLTTAVDSELILVFGSDWNDTANNLTPPAGATPTFTEQVDIAGEYLATGVLSPAGATGNKTMTNNSLAGDGWHGSMVAVQPPSATTAVTPIQTYGPRRTGQRNGPFAFLENRRGGAVPTAPSTVTVKRLPATGVG